MAAGPRDTPHGHDAAAQFGGPQQSHGSQRSREAMRPELPDDARDGGDEPGGLDPFEPLDDLAPLEPAGHDDHLDVLDVPDTLNGLDPLPPADADDLLGPVGDGGPHDGDDLMPPIGDGASFRELRPPRRLRFWQLAPITALAVGGSLMFAFPLAFESGDAGRVVAMLGLLLCLCAAGWGLMAARRVGHAWPGLPSRGSGERPDWRFVAGYTVLIALLAVLAVWRVARLR